MGFARIENIEPAMIEHHADLPSKERAKMRRTLAELRSFLISTDDSIPLCSSLVIVPDVG